MKPLFSALLETIVLVVSVLLVLLGAKLLKYESPYENYSEKYPDRVITVSNALGYVPDGTVLTPEETAVTVAKRFFGNDSEKKLPLFVAKLLCIEIGPKTAKVVDLYSFAVVIETILCLIFGITLPCSLYRHLDPAGSINEFFIDKRYVYVDGDGREYGHVGETRALIVRALLFLFMLFITNVVCSVLPLIIIVNFAVGIVMLVLRLAGVSLSNAARKAKVKSAAGTAGKETYRVIAEHGLFMVSGDRHPNRTLYFNEYWNAVIAQRILELDENLTPYLDQDAEDTIFYGDENVHKRYEINRAMDLLKQILSRKERNLASEIEDEVKKMNYTFSRIYCDDGADEYIIKSNCSDKYMIVRLAVNCALLQAVMNYDAKEKVFERGSWNMWRSMSFDDKSKFLNCYDGYIDSPEEKN